MPDTVVAIPGQRRVGVGGLKTEGQKGRQAVKQGAAHSCVDGCTLNNSTTAINTLLINTLTKNAHAHTNAQATDVLRATGTLSEERQQYLEELRGQLNISKEAGEKIIRCGWCWLG